MTVVLGILLGLFMGFFLGVVACTYVEMQAVKEGMIKINGKIYMLKRMDV